MDVSPAHVLLFCSSCWMYYSVILKPDKGEVGMLENAGECFCPLHASEVERKRNTNHEKCLFGRTNGATSTDLTVSTLLYRWGLIHSAWRCDQNHWIWLLGLSKSHFFLHEYSFPLSHLLLLPHFLIIKKPSSKAHVSKSLVYFHPRPQLQIRCYQLNICMFVRH